MKGAISISLFFLFFALAICGPSISPAPHYPGGRRVKEPAFGLEFTLDHVISSVTLGNHSTYGLAKVPGDDEYRILMRNYLDLCRNVSNGLPAPQHSLLEAFTEGSRREGDRREGLTIRGGDWWKFIAVAWLGVDSDKFPQYKPEIFEGDAYDRDHEVEVLTRAVENAKAASMDSFEERFNNSDPFPWAYASIVAPDFFWTTVKPKPDFDTEPNGLVNWLDNTDSDSVWFYYLLKKFSASLYRNKFRLDGYQNWQEILDSSTNHRNTRPASCETLGHARKYYCADSASNASSMGCRCGPKSLSPSSIVIGLNNDTISLWLEGPKYDWTPWNTFPELGEHALASMKAATPTYWDHVIAKIDALSENLVEPYADAVDLVLYGDGWTDKHVKGLKERVSSHQRAKRIDFKHVVHETDPFAASKAASQWGRGLLDGFGSCGLIIDPGFFTDSYD